MKLLLLTFLSFSISSTVAKGDCDESAYWVNIISEDQKTNEVSYVALGKKSLVIARSDSIYYSESSKDLSGSYTSMFNGKKCGQIEIDDKSFESSGRKLFNYKIKDCEQIEHNPEKRIYAKLDSSRRIVHIGKRLSIEKGTSSKEKKDEIREIIKKTTLRADSHFENSEIIKNKDIQNLDDFALEKINIGKDFSIYIANLHVKNLFHYFSKKRSEYYKKSFEKLKNAKVELPVFFFQTKKGLKYAGDGSYCSEYTVHFTSKKVNNKKSSQSKVVKAERSSTDSSDSYGLGNLGEYEFTDAFDLDGDGVVDILKINLHFAIRLHRDKKPEVIDFYVGY